MSKRKKSAQGPGNGSMPGIGGPPAGEPWHSSPPPSPDWTLEDLMRQAQTYPVAAPVRPAMPWYALGCAGLGAMLGGILGHWAENDPQAIVEMGRSVKPVMTMLNPPTERADVLHLLSEMMEKKGPHQEAAKTLHALISSGAHSGLAEKAHRREVMKERARVRSKIRAQAKKS